MVSVQQTTLFLESLYQREKGKAVLLETRISYSQSEVARKEEVVGIVLSHPYGPLGGNFDNNVIRKLQTYFTQQGFVVVSFNSRGSGNSSGKTSWTGIPETEDYKTIVSYLAKEQELETYTGNTFDFPKPSKIVICGYSYGSVVASSFRPIDIPSVKLYYAFVSYPLSVVWLLTLWKCNWFFKRINEIMGISEMDQTSEQSSLNESTNPRPTLFIYGDRDQFTSLSSYQKWFNQFPTDLTNIKLSLVEGCDHFWFGKEKRIVKCIEDWLNDAVLSG
ncbi:hypothetical protein K7432_008601 [Basidiobolus ranarum]|uniref:Xaa-Pro dipeptidyl-peptidase-like domain-containing protein n=1 Tax=Basidiobolus ranarum TaxID=34480 RepID=A0ABR2VYJ3_9FUNG